MSNIVTFGEVMLRLSPVNYYRLFQNELLQATFGGAEANVAVSLANFGESVSFVTKLPSNPLGDACIRKIKEFNVITDNIVRGGTRLGIYFLEKGVSQRESICVYDRVNSAISEAKRSDFDWDNIFRDAKWFHFTGITPALGNDVAEICIEACKRAKSKCITISCDINYRSKLWSQNEAMTTMSELCQYVDVLIANEEDAELVFGISADNTDINDGKIDKKSYEQVAQELTDLFDLKYVAITLRSSFSASENGWSGLLFDGHRSYYSKEYTVKVVDRVGAGDSFGGGLIYAMLHEMKPQNAIDFAVAASALKHTIEGDFNMVSVDEVNKLANGNASGRIQR